MTIVLETVSGKLIDPNNIDPTLIDINDIGWSLSRINRFSGHTVTTIPYSVAQHCVFVAEMLEEAGHNKHIVTFGLLHDAAEYAIGDIPSPVKKIPELQAVIDPIEERILNAIYVKFVGSAPTSHDWSIVKYYDKRAQFIEAYTFMSSRGLNWIGRGKHDISLIDIQSFPEPVPAIDAYQAFINKFNELQNTGI
jgi:5'-deoxynucleotidase YfbR-like HD superfamily hydrolase